jgi:glycosyltransferase involved in cell wall biosynthesis
LKSLVSILIPAYNAEKWIDYTIKSALEQTWPEKEIIIVDDGSIDNTLKIARHFASKHVKVISQENRGASAARNRALEHAQGDYIQWLDADDLLHDDKISEQMKIAGSGLTNATLLASSFGTFYWRPERAIFAPNALWQDLTPVEWLLIRFSENAWLFPAVWLVSRRLTEKVGPWNTALSLDDDGEYFCRVVAASDHVTFVPEAKSYYRQSGYSQLSRSNNDRANESLLLSLTLCMRHLRQLEESERTKRASLVLLERLYTYFYYFSDKSSLNERVSILAKELGGELVPTRLKRKWNVLRKLLGWKTTRKIMGGAQRSRLMTKIYWDRLLYSMAHRGDDLTEHRIQPV